MPPPALPFWPIAWRGIRGRCPMCGVGPLFSGYLRQCDTCAQCGEALGAIRADDGPAWLTIVLVGHVLAPLLLWLIPGSAWPNWLLMTVWPLAALVLALLLLPRAKGFFIAVLWLKYGTASSAPHPH